jgi:small GTP-binding protein
MTSPPLPHRTKIIVVGATTVGKTSIICAHFNPSGDAPAPTIGCQLHHGVISGQTRRVEVAVWDTAGSEQFRAIVPIYYRSARAVLLVFDVRSKRSLEELEEFIPKLNDICPDALRVLVANKIDLPERIDDYPDLLKTSAEALGVAEVFETSALTGEGIDELFGYIADTVMPESGTEAPMEPNDQACC